jgi:hypothetical protein
MTTPEIIIGALSLVGSIGGGYVALRLRPIEQSIDTNEKSRLEEKKEAHEDAITMRADFERRLSGLHDDSKIERENMERRLSGIERSYASREELASAINAIGGRFDRGVDRVEVSIRSLGDKVDGIGARLSKTEATVASHRSEYGGGS